LHQAPHLAERAASNLECPSDLAAPINDQAKLLDARTVEGFGQLG
jgi:hypothetical protein